MSGSFVGSGLRTHDWAVEELVVGVADESDSFAGLGDCPRDFPDLAVVAGSGESVSNCGEEGEFAAVVTDLHFERGGGGFWHGCSTDFARVAGGAD